MARYIDADKLKMDSDIYNFDMPYGCSFKAIDRQPTADVEVVRHGEWIYNTDDFTPKMRCSSCGYNKCGAKIDQDNKK